MRALSAAARGRQLYDACIVGGGVVGLAVAREMAVRGHSVLLLEKEGSICAGAASSGNSGLVHTGYDAVPGSVESRLMRRSLAIRPALFDAIGLDEHEHWRQAPGSLVLAWNEQERSALQAVMDETREAGDDDTRLLEPSELFALEPGLSRRALGGVLCPHETVTEPWLVCVALGANARQHSAELRQSTELVGAAFSAEDGLWTLRTRMTPPQPPGAVHCPGRSPLGERLAPPPRSDDEARPAYRPPIALEQWISGHAAAVEAAMPEDEFSARVVINCAGLFGDLVEAMRLGAAAAAGDGSAAAAAAAAAPRAAPFTVTPRKGQFAVLRPADPEAEAPRFVLEQIANEFTKGVIVWTTSKERARHARPGTRTRTRTRTRRARAQTWPSVNEPPGLIAEQIWAPVHEHETCLPARALASMHRAWRSGGIALPRPLSLSLSRSLSLARSLRSFLSMVPLPPASPRVAVCSARQRRCRPYRHTAAREPSRPLHRHGHPR